VVLHGFMPVTGSQRLNCYSEYESGEEHGIRKKEAIKL